MFSKSALLLGALTGSAMAAPALSSRQSSSWTLQGFVRSCDDTANTCTYNFDINENDGNPTTHCGYTITGTDQSARTTDYSGVACGSHFSLNQGYDPSGFIVLVVTDTASNNYAFFGYNNDQLADGQVVTPDESQPPKTVGTKRQAAGWTVKAFTRTCDSTKCDYSFTINDGANDHQCTHEDPSTDSSSAPTQSWYSKPCDQDSTWVISWGYNPNDDSAVMTVVNSPAKQDAFFGWNGVNSRTAEPDVGPNSVYNM